MIDNASFAIFEPQFPICITPFRSIERNYHSASDDSDDDSDDGKLTDDWSSRQGEETPSPDQRLKSEITSPSDSV